MNFTYIIGIDISKLAFEEKSNFILENSDFLDNLSFSDEVLYIFDIYYL